MRRACTHLCCALSRRAGKPIFEGAAALSLRLVDRAQHLLSNGQPTLVVAPRLLELGNRLCMTRRQQVLC